jgi:ATP-dependent protease ClpP protease subunit
MTYDSNIPCNTTHTQGQASDVVIKAKEVINNRKVTNDFLAKVCV